MKVLAIGAVALALASVAAADTQPASFEAPAYNVIQENARVAFADQRVTGFNSARDGSLIIMVGANRYYRAVVWEPCRSDLRFRQSIRLDTHPTGTLSRFSSVIVGGRSCPISSLDQIERPLTRAEQASRQSAN